MSISIATVAFPSNFFFQYYNLQVAFYHIYLVLKHKKKCLLNPNESKINECNEV